MILTSRAIAAHRESGEIVIEPFDARLLGTVSYEFHAGSEIARVSGPLDARIRTDPDFEEVPESGYLLEPRHFYLLSTHELLGSTTFAQRIFGTRAIGSSGLFIDVSADLGHVGCITHWTLELVPTLPILLFPGQRIGQITFWTTAGTDSPYSGYYQAMERPLPSQLWKEIEE